MGTGPFMSVSCHSALYKKDRTAKQKKTTRYSSQWMESSAWKCDVVFVFMQLFKMLHSCFMAIVINAVNVRSCAFELFY